MTTRPVSAHGDDDDIDVDPSNIGRRESVISFIDPAGGLKTPVSTVEISVSCRDLPNMDRFSKSDPVCVLSIMEFTGHWRMLGQTEVIWNNLNPNFVRKFIIDYYFEEPQDLRFDIYDVDDEKNIQNLEKQDFIGYYECSLATVIKGRMERPLKGTIGEKGSIQLIAEELSSCKDKVTLEFKGCYLDAAVDGLLGKPRPFLTFHKVNEDGSFSAVHKTEVAKNGSNPSWASFKVSSRALCNADYDRPLQVECFHWNKNGKHILLGVFTTTLKQLTSHKISRYKCYLADKKAKSDKTPEIEVVTAEVESGFTFLDYLKGGTNVHCTIAVDLTRSNGDLDQPHSLHYLETGGTNSYIMALDAVGRILEQYDSDEIFQAYGFGAKHTSNEHTSEMFNLSCDDESPDCHGSTDLVKAYRAALKNCRLSGPAKFSPLINHVVREASHPADGSDYYILLILTCGDIHDLPETVRAVIESSNLPVSIIIVGIGDGDFKAMRTLDADKTRLFANGRYSERDNVQFVPLRDFIEADSGLDTIQLASFTKEVLFEVPDQIMSFMRLHGIKPLPISTRRPPKQQHSFA